MAKYLTSVYVSGWQCSSTASTSNEPGPDVADYPYDTVPNKAWDFFRMFWRKMMGRWQAWQGWQLKKVVVLRSKWIWRDFLFGIWKYQKNHLGILFRHPIFEVLLDISFLTKSQQDNKEKAGMDDSGPAIPSRKLTNRRGQLF